MIYFTSDLHFYHNNIIRHCNRPFSDAEEMNKTLVKNWNAKVGVKDEVYILGDVTLKGYAYAMEALRQLKGRKYLVKGNHDLFARQSRFDKDVFEWIKDYFELSYCGEQFVLFHYPLVEWNRSLHGSYHLHGHQHNHEDYNYQNRENGIRRFDVGVDANGMRPVSIKEIITFFSLCK